MSELADNDSINTPGGAATHAAATREGDVVREADVVREVGRRRTFAIISHPDAGKTTLTEKLLLFGGAIQMAGTVKARKSSRHATQTGWRSKAARHFGGQFGDAIHL